MIEATKYQFDVEFGESGQMLSVPVVRKKFSHDEVEQIKAETYAAGEASATACASEAAADALAQISNHLQMILQRLDQDVHTAKEAASQLALVTAQTLAGKAIAKYPADDITAIVDECLHTMPHMAQVTITVASSLYEMLEPRLNALVDQQHFTGRLTIKQSDSVAVGDCRIEWPNGGLVRDVQDITAQVQEIVSRHLQSEEAEFAQYDLFEHPHHAESTMSEGDAA